jgi:hypothetical protein
MPLIGTYGSGSSRGYGRFGLVIKRFRSIRYIRWYVNGSTANSSSHFIELQAITYDGVNRALNAGINGRISQYTGGTPEGTWNTTSQQILTDGDTTNSGYFGFSTGGGGVQIDLGSIYTDIKEIRWWNYYSDNRSYYQTTLYISTDGSNWTNVFGPATFNSSNGGGLINNPEL